MKRMLATGASRAVAPVTKRRSARRTDPLGSDMPKHVVPNIVDAQPRDYRKATVIIHHAPATTGFIELPVVVGS